MTNITRRQALGIIVTGALWPSLLPENSVRANLPQQKRRPFEVDLPKNPTPYDVAYFLANWERRVIQFNEPQTWQWLHYTGGIQWCDGWLAVYGVGSPAACQVDRDDMHEFFCRTDELLGEGWTSDRRGWCIVVRGQCSKMLAEDLRRDRLRQHLRSRRRGKAVSA